MQIYCAYIVEMCTLSLPILILQVINNAMLDDWNFSTIFTTIILAINLLIDLRGIISIDDKMSADKADGYRRK